MKWVKWIALFLIALIADWLWADRFDLVSFAFGFGFGSLIAFDAVKRR
jgi:hypothetical protein